jgi:hypothetical protein
MQVQIDFHHRGTTLCIGHATSPSTSANVPRSILQIEVSAQVQANSPAIPVDSVMAKAKYNLQANDLASRHTQNERAQFGEPIPPPVCSAIMEPPPIVRIEKHSASPLTPQPEPLWAAARTAIVAAVSVMIALLCIIVVQTRNGHFRRLQQQRADELGMLASQIETQLAKEDVSAATRSLDQLMERLGEPNDSQWENRVQKLTRQLRACEQKLAARTLWMSAKQAIDDGQCLSAIGFLQKYLATKQAEYRPDALQLLEEAKLAISEPLAAQEVATWTDEQLAGLLTDGRHPELTSTPIRSRQLLVVYDRVLREQTQLEQARRSADRERRKREDAEKERLARDTAEKLRNAEKETRRAAWQLDLKGQRGLRLIPADCAGALATQGYLELQTKILKLATDIGLGEYEATFRFFAVPWIKMLIPLESGFSHTRPLAIVLANPAKAKVELREANNAVLVVPVDDAMKASAHWKIDILKPGDGRAVEAKIHRISQTLYAASRDDYLFLGDNPEAVQSVAASIAAGETLASQIDPDEGRKLAESDLLLFAGTQAWGSDWIKFIKSIESAFDAGDEDPDARALWEAFLTTLRHIRYGVVGARIEKGVKISAQLVFSEHEDARVQHFLSILNAGNHPPELTSLPHDHALWAFAARGDGLANVVTAHALFNVAWNYFLAPEKLAIAKDRPRYYQRFAQAWRHVRGARAGLYHTGLTEEEGRYTTVAILDSETPDKVVANIVELVAEANDAARRVAEAAGKPQTIFYEVESKDFDGREIKVITISDASLSSLQIATANEELGPDWNRLRIVSGEKEVVLFLGSDLGVLRQTLKNLDEARPGLADNAVMNAHRASADADRKVQFEVAVESFLSTRVAKPPSLAVAKHYSSSTLSIAQQAITLHLSFPVSELRAALGRPQPPASTPKPPAKTRTRRK